MADASEVEVKLRATLGEYNKKTHLNQSITQSKDYQTNRRAASLDTEVGGDIPETNTSRVYLLWQAIINKALPSQLQLLWQN